MQQTDGLDDAERLFLNLSEQLSRPFLQLARTAELARQQDVATAHNHWQQVELVSQSALKLVESYALNLRLRGNVSALQLEPITLSSLLYDTAHELQPLAHRYEVALELEPGPKMLPVLADRTVLHSALTALGQVFVLAQAESDEAGAVRLAAHRSRYGVVAGLYSPLPQLGSDSLRRARTLGGRAREPLQRLVSGPATGVFVADALLQSLETRLHAARYHGLTGLATTLSPSQQMQLV